MELYKFWLVRQRSILPLKQTNNLSNIFFRWSKIWHINNLWPQIPILNAKKVSSEQPDLKNCSPCVFYGLQFRISATVRYFTRSKTEAIAKSKSTFLQKCAFSWNNFLSFSEKKNLLYCGHWGSNCEFSFFAHKGMYINRRHFKWTPHGIKIFMKSHSLSFFW